MKETRVLEPTNIIIASIKIIRSELFGFEKVGSDASIIPSIEEYVSPDGPLIKLVVHIRISDLGSEGKNFSKDGRFSVEFLFELRDFEIWVEIDLEQKTVEIDSQMAGALRGIAYSTTRGMLYQHSMGTSFMGLTLPVIDPKKIVRENTPPPQKKITSPVKKKGVEAPPL